MNAAAKSALAEFRFHGTTLLGCFVGAMCGVSALYFYTQGLFIKPIAAEFGWSRTALSVGGFITLCANAVLAPICGAAIDQFGVRRVATLSLFGFAAALWLLTSLSGSITEYYGVMLLLALLSAGTTPLSFSRAINERFVAGRGTALGIVGAGIGVTAALAPGLFTEVLADEGWRRGYAVMALIVLVATPVVWLFLREPRVAPRLHTASPGGSTVAQAVRMTRFWLLGAMLLLAAVGASAVIVHFVPMLTDAGLSPPRAARYAFVIGVSVTLSRLVVGALLDRVFGPRIALLVFTAAACGALLLALFSVRVAWLAAVLMGLALGAESDLTGYLIARYFGIRAYGFIYGTLYAAFLVGMAVGPVLAGMVFDARHSYQLALYGVAVAFGSAALLATLLGPFPHFQDSTEPVGRAGREKEP